jgi:hypothetical protein
MCNSADLEFRMAAGTSIAARRAMAAQLPLEMQMYMAPAVQQGLQDAGYKVNWLELARRGEQATGWNSPDDVIIPITDEDIKRRMASNPEVIKAQATQARIAQLHQNNMQLSQQEHGQDIEKIDAKGLANVGENVLTRTLERAATREELSELAGTFGG